MLQRIEQIGSYLSLRDASIRTKVVLAFLGVLLLILPQIFLTVSYMVELFENGESVGRSSSASLTVGEIHSKIEQNFLAPYPVTLEAFTAHHDAVQEVAGLIEETEQSFGALEARDARFAVYVAALSDIRKSLKTYGDELRIQVEANVLLEPSIKRREVTSRVHQELDDLTRAWDEPPLEGEDVNLQTPEDRLNILRKLTFRAIKDVVSAQNQDDSVTALRVSRGLMQANDMWTQRRTILGSVGELRARVNSENAMAAEEIKRSVNEANRYLITLVLLTLVYIFIVILVLPSRLVRPLVHFTSVMERAATGQLDVRARVVGDDEMGDMGKRFNIMLERLGTFDRLKRDRIYEDGARIHSLGDRIDHPLAILDTNLAFEYANSSMRKLLALSDDLEGRELYTVVGGDDARDLVALLDKTLKRRRRLDGVVLQLETKHGTKTLAVSTEVGRNRAGQISYLILSLVERV